MEETGHISRDREPYNIPRLNEFRKRVTFGAEQKTYYVYEDPEEQYCADDAANQARYIHTEINMDVNDNLEEDSGFVRIKPSEMKQFERDDKPSAKALLLEMIQELAIPVNSVSSHSVSSHESTLQNRDRPVNQGNFPHWHPYPVEPMPKRSNRPLKSFSVRPKEFKNPQSNPSVIRHPKPVAPIRPPPLNNHQLFIVNMANRQTRQWGELNLMVAHEPPWKAINISKEETEPKKDLKDKPTKNKSRIGQTQASSSKALSNSKYNSPASEARTSNPNQRDLSAVVEEITLNNNNESEEQTDDSDAIGRFVITTERKHLNRLKKLLTNPKMLKETKSMETRKLLGRDLKMAEIVELCPSREQKISKRPYEPMIDFTSSCEVIGGSQKTTSLSDISELGKNQSTKDSFYDQEESVDSKNPKQYFSLKEKMSSWGKLKLVKDYVPPWKVIKTAKTTTEGKVAEIDKRVNKISSAENALPVTASNDPSDEELNVRDTKSASSNKRSVPKMMVVPSTRKVDHARGHTSMEIASFVNTRKYGQIPSYILRPFIPPTTSRVQTETNTEVIEDKPELKEEQIEQPATTEVTEPIVYTAMREEANRMNEMLRSNAFVFQRNVATPNPVFWNAPVSRHSSRKQSGKGQRQNSGKARKVNSHLKQHMELKTIRDMDIALAEQIMEQNRQLGFKPGRLSLKELSYRTGLPLDFIKLWDQQRLPLSYYDTRKSFLRKWIPPWKTAVYKSITRVPSNLSQESRTPKRSRTTFQSRSTLHGVHNKYGFKKNRHQEKNFRKFTPSRSPTRVLSPSEVFQKGYDDSNTDLEDLRRYTPSAGVSSSESEELSEPNKRSRRSSIRRARTYSSFGTADESPNREERENQREAIRSKAKLLKKSNSQMLANKTVSKRKVARQSRLREKRHPPHRQDSEKADKILEDIVEDLVMTPMTPDPSGLAVENPEYGSPPRGSFTSEEELKSIKKKIQGIVNQVVDPPKLRPKKCLSSPVSRSLKDDHKVPSAKTKNVDCQLDNQRDRIEKMTDDEFDLALYGKISEIKRSKGLASEKEKVKQYLDDGWTTVDDSDVDEYESGIQESQNSLPETISAHEDEEEASESISCHTSAGSMECPIAIQNCTTKVYKIQEHMSRAAEKKMMPLVLRGRVTSAPGDLHMNTTDSLTDFKDTSGRPQSINKDLALRGCTSFLL